MTSHYAIAFSHDGALAFTGTASGELYVWEGNMLVSVLALSDKGPLAALVPRDDGILCGTYEGDVHFVQLQDSGEFVSEDMAATSLALSTPGKAHGLNALALAGDGSFYVAGTRTNCVVVMESAAGAAGESEAAVEAPYDEVWGLSQHPTDDAFAIVAYDRLLRIYDVGSRRQAYSTVLPAAARCVSWAPDGMFIAVGMVEGRVVVLSAETWEVVWAAQDRREVINAVTYSPDGQTLAVGSGDNYIDLYQATKNYKRYAVCTGHSSFVTHIDFSQDSAVLQTNSGDYEMLYWERKTGFVSFPTLSRANIATDTCSSSSSLHRPSPPPPSRPSGSRSRLRPT